MAHSGLERREPCLLNLICLGLQLLPISYLVFGWHLPHYTIPSLPPLSRTSNSSSGRSVSLQFTRGLTLTLHKQVLLFIMGVFFLLTLKSLIQPQFSGLLLGLLYFIRINLTKTQTWNFPTPLIQSPLNIWNSLIPVRYKSVSSPFSIF